MKLSKSNQTVHFDIQDAALNQWGGVDQSTYKWRRGIVFKNKRVLWFRKYIKVAPIETSGPDWYITGRWFKSSKGLIFISAFIW